MQKHMALFFICQTIYTGSGSYLPQKDTKFTKTSYYVITDSLDWKIYYKGQALESNSCVFVLFCG
jgi:hypothetical protein